MKGIISRHSHVTAKGYSGVFHNQGGMITDADLNEGALIARTRVERMGNDAIVSGAPAKGGIVANQTPEKPLEPFIPFLRPGIVYAEGLRGIVRGAPGVTYDANEPLRLIKEQQDLLDATLPADGGHHVIYADIWHRSVHPLEDARLAEIAFHGAQTSFRQKTVAQLKWAPQEEADSLGKAYGNYPQVGGGLLSLAPVNGAQTGNVCDPCATEIPLDAQVPNALFRVEVVAVTGTAQKPGTVTLAWSMENGAEIADPRNAPDGFGAPGYAYEYTDVKTEGHKGAFTDPAERAVSVFDGALNTTSAMPLVRRWDGQAVFALDDKVASNIGSDTPALAVKGMPQITTGFFTVTLDLRDKPVLVGDYWLVEVRTNGAQTPAGDGRFHVVSEAPLGIHHHYAPLFEIKDGVPLALSDSALRQVTFPPLTDIPASHVSYRNTCAKLYGDPANGGAVTVQQALDALCAIDTGDIALKTPCPTLFGNATTLDDALKALCAHDFSNGSDKEWMKYMMDWGVVCGLQITKSATGVRVMPGAYLDWAGDFVVVPWDTAKVFAPDQIRLDPDVWKLDEPRSFGLERLDGRTVTAVIAPWSKFTRSSDRTLYQRNQDCNVASAKVGADDVVKGLDKKAKSNFYTAMTPVLAKTWKTNPPRMTATATEDVYQSVEKMVQTAFADNEAQANLTMVAVRAARSKYPADGLRGIAQQEAHGRQASGMVAVAINASDLLRAACKCLIVLPGCPDFRQSPVMVPLGEAAFTGEDGVKTIDHICTLTYRRQALTPRTMSYYMRETIEQIMAGILTDSLQTDHPMGPLAAFCCRKPDAPSDDSGIEVKPGKDPAFRPGYLDRPGRYYDTRKPYDLGDLTYAAAVDELTGNGIDIIDEIDIRAAAADGKLEAVLEGMNLDSRIRNGEAIGPGDSVVLLMDGPAPVGYLLAQQGGGKYPFPPRSEQMVVMQQPGYENKPPMDTGGLDLGALDGQLGQIRQQYTQLSGQIAGLRGDSGTLAQLQATYANLDAAIGERLAAAKAEAVEIGGDLPEMIAGYQATMQDISTALESHGATISDIEAREAGMKDRLDAQLQALLADGLGDHEEAMKTLLGQLAVQLGETSEGHQVLAGKLAAAGESLSALQKDTDAVTGQIDRARDWLAGDALGDLLGQIDALDQRRVSIGSAVSEGNDTLSGMAERLQGLRGALAGVADSFPDLDGKVSSLRDSLQAIAKDLPEMLSARDAADASHGALLEDRRKQATALTTQIQGQITQTGETLAGLSATQQSLDAAIGRSDAALRKLEAERSASLGAAQEELQALINALAENNAQVAAQTQSLTDLRKAALADAMALRADADKKIAELAQARGEFDTDIDILRGGIADVRDDLQGEGDVLSALEGRIDGLRDMLAMLGEVQPDVDGRLDALMAKYEMLKSDLPALLESRAAADADHAARVEGLGKEADRVIREITNKLAETDATLGDLTVQQGRLDTDIAGSRDAIAAITADYTARLGALEVAGKAAVAALAADNARLFDGIEETDAQIARLSNLNTRLRENMGPTLDQMQKQSDGIWKQAEVTNSFVQQVKQLADGVAQDLPGLEATANTIIDNTKRALNAARDVVAAEVADLRRESSDLVRMLRSERPVAAVPRVAKEKLAARLANFGIFTAGELRATKTRDHRAMAEKDPPLFEILDVLADQADDFVTS